MRAGGDATRPVESGRWRAGAGYLICDRREGDAEEVSNARHLRRERDDRHANARFDRARNELTEKGPQVRHEAAYVDCGGAVGVLRMAAEDSRSRRCAGHDASRGQALTLFALGMFGDQRLVKVYRQEVDADLERGARAVFISIGKRKCAHRGPGGARVGRSSASIAACSSHLIEPRDHALNRLVKRYPLLHLRMRHRSALPLRSPLAAAAQAAKRDCTNGVEPEAGTVDRWTTSCILTPPERRASHRVHLLRPESCGRGRHGRLGTDGGVAMARLGTKH